MASRRGIPEPIIRGFLAALSVFGLQSAQGDDQFPAERIRVVAVIDGADVLHLSKTEAKWTHRSWSWPTNVKINGQSWNPQEQPIWKPPGNTGLLRGDLDLSGAVLHVLRGRGSVQFDRDADGFNIHFDDPDSGSDTYEFTIDFAQVLASNWTSSLQGNDLRIRIAARIDGTDEVWLSSTGLDWTHTTWSLPQNISVNGKAWDLAKTTHFPLDPGFSTESMDLQRASLQKNRGRGWMNLDYRPERLSLDFENYDASVGGDFKKSTERLCLDFDDPPGGDDGYEATITVPRFRQRYLVSLNAHSTSAILGTPLRIFRLLRGSEAQAVIVGQRSFGPDGRCVAALETGRYQFEALRQDSGGSLIALKTGEINITGPTNIDLQPRQATVDLIGPGDTRMLIDSLSIRSARPGGAVAWNRLGSETRPPIVAFSKGEKYKIHAFGHAGTNYVAVWTTVVATNTALTIINNNQWLERSISWREGTPRTIGRGVILDFPDGKFEIPAAGAFRLLTNRRFFTVAYWLDFPGNRRAIFEPLPCFAVGNGKLNIVLGGELHPLASAALMEDENEKPGEPKALNVWHELTLGDPGGYILDTADSTIDWIPRLRMKDGSAFPSVPLSSDFVAHLGSVKDHLIATATYSTDGPHQCAIAPEPLANFQFGRFSMKAPPYRGWNTMSYLSKAERELSLTFFVRGLADEPGLHLDIKWWLNGGAVGGGNSITMPINGYLTCKDWYGHPWAIAHEMLHNLGFGHTHEMSRVDAAVQEQMDFFRWSAADTPNYVPAQYFGR